MITASEVRFLVTPTLKVADNDKTRLHLWELAAQRITKYVEPSYINDNMLRGHNDEILARELYNNRYAKVSECGFVTNDSFGFIMGCSPDGLVGEDGMIECKSRLQKYQIRTIVEHWRDDTEPGEFSLQVQAGLLITGRAWCDLLSYSGGLPMMHIRIQANPEIQGAIIAAAAIAEQKIDAIIADYADAVKARDLPMTKLVEQEMF